MSTVPPAGERRRPSRVVLLNSVTLNEAGTAILAERWATALTNSGFVAHIWSLSRDASSPSSMRSFVQILRQVRRLGEDEAILVLGLPRELSRANRLITALLESSASSAVLWERPGVPVSAVHSGLVRLPNVLLTLSTDHLERLKRLHSVPVRQVGLAIPKVFFQTSRPTSRALRTAVFVGRFNKQKNVELLALNWIDKVYPKWALPLTLAGAGLGSDATTERRIAYLAETYSDIIKVTRLGSDVERAHFLANASVALFPALYDHLPQAMLEAMAVGVPVIGSAIPGHMEVLKPGVTGYLCHPSLIDLSQAVQDIVSRPSKARAIGISGRAYALSHHSMKSTGRDLSELVLDMAAGA